MEPVQRPEPLRRTSSRARTAVDTYFPPSAYGDLDREDPQNVRHHLEQLRARAIDVGFTGLFEVMLEVAVSEDQQFRSDTHDFVQTGGLFKMYQLCRQHYGPAALPNDPAMRREVCDAAQAVYLDEWNQIIKEKAFRTPFAKFSAQYIESFSFAQIYAQMLTLAPCLFALLAIFTTRPTRPSSNRASRQQVDEKFRQRVVVVAVAALANIRNQKVNIVQCFVAFYLYASNVPKRVMAVLDHLGISASYASLRRALSANRDAMAAARRDMTARGNAQFWSYDNLQKACNVRDERIENKGGFLLATVGYVYEPPPNRRQPMLTPDDCDYHKSQTLTARDFLPSDADNQTLELAFQCMIWKALQVFAEGRSAQLPALRFEMPIIHQIDRSERPTIMSLPMYNRDEKRLDHVIDIHYAMQEDMGWSEQRATNNIMQCRGDLFTVEQNRCEQSATVLTVQESGVHEIRMYTEGVKRQPELCGLRYRMVSFADADLGSPLSYASRGKQRLVFIRALDYSPRTESQQAVGRAKRLCQELPCM